MLTLMCQQKMLMMNTKIFKLDESKVYSVKDIDELLKDVTFILSNKGIYYANVPCTIDIETSSFYENGEKRAIQYAWVLGIGGKCIIGRYFSALKCLINTIASKLELSNIKHHERRMVFYVHNLSYEFQWFRKHFEWDKVFSIEERKPLYALMKNGIELRCSYLLSGYSLAKVGDQLTKYKVQKRVGDLDYKKVRTPKTPLTPKEKDYVLYDGLVVLAYIQEQIESHHDNITLLPLTKTGEVRNYCRKECLYKGGKKHNSQRYQKYTAIMKNIPIVDVGEYRQLQRAFAGGFTHANGFYVNTIQKNVGSFDFTSSYPTVIVCEKFPMSKGELVKITNRQEFFDNLTKYCCLFDIEFDNIRAKLNYDNPISYSKCYECIKPHVNNGRIVSAERLAITITEQDFFTFQDFYEWDNMRIRNFRRYRKNYLPRDFVLAVLNLYAKKTTLKGVVGKEIEYLVSKENVNSCYGMMVTDICRDEIEYGKDEWNIVIKSDEDVDKAIKKYNSNKRRFLCYQWGIWVTAYARRNLFSGIKEFGYDYIYSDTDSLKVLNYERHMDYINKYNNGIKTKIKHALFYQNIPLELAHPKTVKGVEKWLGVWDFEGVYKRFKTLGAKRYMVEEQEPINYDGEPIPYSLTVSGINKKIAIPYLYHLHGDNIFNAFTDGLYVPKGYTGKNIHTYIDEETSGVCVDYRGVPYKYHELSSIHMEECDYELSLSREFIDFIMEIHEVLR